MTLDIRTGDFLVIGDNEYPIKKANVWTVDKGSTASFVSMASVSCSTKRSPDEDDDGFIGAPEAKLSSLSCLPLDPVSADMARTEGLEAMLALKCTMISDSNSFAQVYVEDVKRT